jgi:hypothetical protein
MSTWRTIEKTFFFCCNLPKFCEDEKESLSLKITFATNFLNKKQRKTERKKEKLN